MQPGALKSAWASITRVGGSVPVDLVMGLHSFLVRQASVLIYAPRFDVEGCKCLYFLWAVRQHFEHKDRRVAEAIRAPESSDFIAL